jgi:hypothetical protein
MAQGYIVAGSDRQGRTGFHRQTGKNGTLGDAFNDHNAYRVLTSMD